MTCDRYPDRPVLKVKDTMKDAPQKIRLSMMGTCDHGHPSSFEGETFFCGGTLTGPLEAFRDGAIGPEVLCPRHGFADCDCRRPFAIEAGRDD